MKKIMLVEDEAVIAVWFQERLEAMGYQVVGTCYDSEEAVREARRLHPDLILMDIMIPGKFDGISAAGIAKDELDIPVIFVTAYAEEQIIERAKRVEPYGFIVKPIETRELKAAVEIALFKKDMERRMKASEQQCRSMIDAMSDAVFVVNRKLEIIMANPSMIDWNREFGFETDVVGRSFSELYPFVPQKVFRDFEAVLKTGEKVITEETFMFKETEFFVDVRKVPIFENGVVERIVIVVRDISENKRIQNSIKESHAALEQRVNERTRELELKTKTLEEVNMALKVILNKRKEDKKDLEKSVLTNVREMIGPYLKKIRKTHLDDQQKTLFDIIESSLNEIISPFSRELSLNFSNLTPTEIQIAGLIKQGLASKKIAAMMNISPRTVDAHRKNIRRKIGLKKKVNLRSYLISYQ